MHLQVGYDPRGTVVQCSGAVESHDGPVLSAQLRKALVEEPTCVVCDLSRVTQLSPVCSSVFVTVAAERSWPGPPLVLAAAPQPVRSVLQSTGTSHFVAVCDT